MASRVRETRSKEVSKQRVSSPSQEEKHGHMIFFFRLFLVSWRTDNRTCEHDKQKEDQVAENLPPLDCAELLIRSLDGDPTTGERTNE